MKKVISFCWYGKSEKYNTGLVENIKLHKLIYSDWVVRVYYTNDVDIDLLNSFNDVEKVFINNNLGRIYPMFCRFLPAADKSVDVFISRDLDSRINYREEEAVNEWLRSGKRLHIMRDHRHHSVRPIMGGMWGLKGYFYIDKLINDYQDYNSRSADQKFLKAKVWPIFKNDYLAHDSYPTDLWGESKRFPKHKKLLLNGSYVGEVYDEYNRPVFIANTKKV